MNIECFDTIGRISVKGLWGVESTLAIIGTGGPVGTNIGYFDESSFTNIDIDTNIEHVSPWDAGGGCYS
eukprot:1195559-Prorocentrum_minimum.AAC.1